ncbi:MAG: PAS domain S-box protein [Pyrinomonadaceae bacterium]
MATKDNEDELLRSVALQNAQSIIQARRRAEDELRRQSEWLRVTLASIGDAVICTDGEGRVTFLNQVAETLTGWRQIDAESRPLTQIFHIVNETTREVVANPALRALAEGGVVGLANHTILIARDGTEYPIDDSAAPIRDANGNVLGVVLVFHDVTERRRSEEALSRSERELADFFENAIVGFRWAGPDGIIQRVNQTELSMLGYTREEYVGHHLSEFHVDRAGIDEFFDRLKQGETVRQYASQMRCKDGSIRDVLINSNVLFENGEFVHTRAFTLDVTERKRAQESQRQSEERLRFIMDSMPQKIFTTTPDGAASYVNPQWCKFSGLTADEFNGFAWAKTIHPDDRAQVVELWRRSVETGTDFRYEMRFRRWDGIYIWHLTQTTALRDDQGEVVMWVGSSTDVHEQKETSQQLRHLAAELSEADHRKNEFLAILAHELRNPLAPIRNALRVVQLSGGDRDVILPAAEMMERQVDQLVRLVDDLLDVSRVSHGRIELRREHIELAAVIHRAVETCQPAIDERRHELLVTLPDAPVFLNADPHRLAQTFSNLLNNAGKYTDPGGRISISATVRERFVEVSIKDSGIGIPVEKQGNIFDMFAQVDRSLERSQGGLGIGLTLVKKLVELHEGSVRLLSAGAGLGSEFVVRLPVTVHEPALPAPAGPTAPFIRRRVLVVDDNRDAAESLQLLLQICGHEVHTAYDGLEAVEAADRLRPEVVLLDIGLPKLNGYEAARLIRAQTRKEKITLVALTGWGQADDLAKSREAGFDLHLVKPVDHDLLLKVFAELPSEEEGE